MDIYHAWLPTQATYLFHLLFWIGGIILLQWIFFWRLFLGNWRAVLLGPFLLGTYLIATDVVAVKLGIWYFDPQRILGLNPLGVPIEEWLFFYLTAALVAQSFVLFLPASYRYPPRLARARSRPKPASLDIDSTPPKSPNSNRD
ncbi:MAG: lycopene cyclase domain-containing protein [Puniceicoccaceae bacterium]